MQLWVNHYLGPVDDDLSLALKIQTCQRTVWISESVDLSQIRSSNQNFESYKDWEAYAFLLRWICGLESKVRGETDVFGQFKSALNDFQKTCTLSLAENLLEDVKEIRANYLQGIGGRSYGTLAKRFLKINSESKVLLLGTGKLSQKMIPVFNRVDLTIWNRSPSSLSTLNVPFEEIPFEKFDAVCFAIPVVFEQEILVLERLKNKRVLHLGGSQKELEHWQFHPDFGSLTDLFEIQKELNLQREDQFKRAERAIELRAKLRALGPRIAHGWEDLGFFYG